MRTHVAEAYRVAVLALAVGLLAAMTLGGCTEEAPPPADEIEPPPSAMQPTEPPREEPAEQPADETAAEAPEEVAEDTAEDAASRTVVRIKTDKGDMVAELFDETMPITAGNFILLAESGFYDGLTFHRVEPRFVIQGGCPEGTGFGGPGFTIPRELNDEVPHDRGVLSMARSDHPDSAGSQFFVCLSREECRHLDGAYAAFGRVIEGIEVADRIAVGDRISTITIESESEHADAAREAAKKARIYPAE